MDVILERLTLSSHEKTLVRADAGFGVSLSDEDVGDLPSRSPSPSPSESFDVSEPSADHWERRSSPSRSPEGVRRGTGAGGSLQTTGLAPYMTKEVQGLRNRHRRMRYDLQALRENQAVMNGTLNQIRVGQDCDILEFADWCANCSAHIIVVSLTNSAVEPQASVGSATVVTAQTVTPGSISWQLVDVPWQLAGMALEYATAGIINKKFVLSLARIRPHPSAHCGCNNYLETMMYTLSNIMRSLWEFEMLLFCRKAEEARISNGDY